MADELASFVIKHLDGLKRSEDIGAGSYGVVCEVKVNGLPCIAKRLHNVLTNEQHVSQQERRAINERFREECILLSCQRHPNIVQFLGVHYGRDRYDLTLVMERMHMDLGTALEKVPNMSLSTKLRILLDASYGLMHLHCQTPPIVHRDFTAANVLLSPDMRAKVADLGVSKILNMSPQELSKLTKCPGALGYMPPEALQQNPVYNVKLDIFSFGHLTLYTVNQKFPEVYELGPEQVIQAVQNGTAQLAKRQVAIDMMGKDHCLHQLVTDCLQDDPEKRPTTSQVNSILQELAAHHPVKDPHDTAENFVHVSEHGHSCDVDEHIFLEENLKLLKEVNKHLTSQQMKFENETEELRLSEERARVGLKALRDNYRKMADENKAMNSEVKTLQKHTKTLSSDLASSDAKIKNLNQEIEALQKINTELLSQIELANVQAAAFIDDFETERTKTATRYEEQIEELHVKLRIANEQLEHYQREF